MTERYQRDSCILLIGTVHYIVLLDRGIRFNLQTKDGLFSISAQPGIGYGWLRPAARICVLGWVRAYYHRRGRTYRVVIEATALLPAGHAVQPTFLSRAERATLLRSLVSDLLSSRPGPFEKGSE